MSAVILSGCDTTSPTAANLAGPRGASVAFETIDGPPPDVFRKLVRNLNSEAQSRQIAVLSRDDVAAYRVRGYLGASSDRTRSTISWLWDVYDSRQQRVLRLAGEEKIAGRNRDAWASLDDATVEKIARTSMDELAAFLKSPAAMPERTPAFAATDASTPEGSGIFRIWQIANEPSATAEAGDAGDDVPVQPASVPLPPQRPTATERAKAGPRTAAMSGLTLAAASAR